ncbi:hypothetical protein PHLCEN_2v11888 [Hermanssonia centrifuga]|uniref:Hydroxyneurosporene synthase n=1 Tax=Hermanssonia centrifuga TaxID=98765 RepID=A0A2R6NIV2_9APHY|nr:hypothetical protein PHLCEN_2v11888 [Hermanssonia centrifuga]
MIQPWPLLLIPLLAVLRTATGASVPISIDVIPGTTSSSPSVAQFSSLSSGFDAPKVKSLNSTSFDWWYFDVVSSDLDYSLVVVFFTADATGLWTGTTDVGTADYVAISVTSTDGALFNVGVLAEELIVVTIGDGSSGILDGTLTGWTGSPDMSQYEILVDDPVSGLQGTVSFQSIAPAHFPCAPATAPAGQPLNLGDNFELGWLNAVPDANAVVDFDFNGTKVQFSGSGYHDKNWGAKPMYTAVKAWYWGHARFGPYSLVWFDFVAPDGTEQASNYLARDGEIMTSTCSGLSVRAIPESIIFPPTPASDPPQGFTITADIEGEGVLEVQVTHKQEITQETGTSLRWIGSVTGKLGNGTVYEGTALYEQFTFAT